jgi:spore germination protein KB
MIKKYDGKIGTLEFLFLIIVCIASRITDISSILLIRSGLNAAWMLPIISSFIILIPFLCTLSLLKLYKNKGLLDIIYHLTGRFLGLILVSILFLIVLDNTIIVTRGCADILSTMFYIKTPVSFLLLLIIVSSVYIAGKGFSTIGSLCWLIYPLIQAITLIIIPLIWREMDFHYLFPLGGPGVLNLLKQGVMNTPIVNEVIILSIFFPVLRSFKDYKNASAIGLVISALQLSLFMIVYIAIYGYPTLITLNYPFHQITSIAHLGRFATNLEALFLGFWTFTSSIRFSVYYCSAATIASSMIKIKNIKLMLLFIGIITFLAGYIGESFAEYLFAYQKLRTTIIWVYIICLPIMLWLIAQLKGEYRS